MKFKFLLIFTVLFAMKMNATILKDSVAVNTDSIGHWKESNNAKFILTQNSFVNWSAGGNNSISGMFKLHSTRNYKYKHLVWSNELKANYGVNKESERELRKTEDKFEVNSTFGYRKNTKSNWYYSAKFNFRTQFTKGYKYPNKEKPISKMFAPGYMFMGVGTEFFSKENKLRLYLSPITNKTTFVFSQTLANEGAFGVDKATYDDDGKLLTEGKNVRMEFGHLFTCEWKTEVMENINMANKLILYSDYLNNYGNFDVNWELGFDMTVNKYITANIGTHLKYDDDTKHKEDIDKDGELDILGPRIQLKQLLGIGFSYNF